MLAIDMKSTLTFCVFLFCLSAEVALAEENTASADQRQHITEPVLPFLLGAGVLTWAYCKHGPDDCRTNTQRLWGTAVALYAGIALWVWTSDHRARLGIELSPHGAPVFAFQYRFDG